MKMKIIESNIENYLLRKSLKINETDNKNA